MEQLGNNNVIVLGDFNAVFDFQSENHRYLESLTKTYGYIELCSKEESMELHYTYLDSKNHCKKLDHIFVSQTLFNQLKEYKITYID